MSRRNAWSSAAIICAIRPNSRSRALRSALAGAVIGRDGDGGDLADARAVDHDIVLRGESFGAEEVGSHGVGVIAEEITQQPGGQTAGGEEREQQLHRLFPNVCNKRSARSWGAVGVPPPRSPGNEPGIFWSDGVRPVIRSE